MDGVTVLQTIPAVFPFVSKTELGVALTISLLLLVYCVWCMTRFSSIDIYFKLSMFLLAVCLVLVFVICVKHPEQYKVTLSDSVSYNEFVAHYEVIETDENILTVEERKGEQHNENQH